MLAKACSCKSQSGEYFLLKACTALTLGLVTPSLLLPDPVIPLSSCRPLFTYIHLSAGLQTCGDTDWDHLIHCSILSILLTQRRGLNKYLLDKWMNISMYVYINYVLGSFVVQRTI